MSKAIPITTLVQPVPLEPGVRQVAADKISR